MTADTLDSRWSNGAVLTAPSLEHLPVIVAVLAAMRVTFCVGVTPYNSYYVTVPSGYGGDLAGAMVVAGDISGFIVPVQGDAPSVAADSDCYGENVARAFAAYAASGAAVRFHTLALAAERN